MKADTIIKNGRVMDTARQFDGLRDIAVKNGRIVPMEDGMEAATVINAAGCLVTNGLIDFHAHIFEHGTDSGINPDIAMLPNGITTVVDAGSAGVSTYRSFLDRLDRYRIKSKFFLHVSPTGQITHQYPESVRPDKWNMDKFADAVALCGDRMLGFKVRISRNVVGDECEYVLDSALKLADSFGMSLVVHVTDPAIPQSKIASMLRSGDVFCHMYHGRGNTIVENGHVAAAIREARRRGVIFDCCHGSINFNFAIAEQAAAEGFWPDIISSDMNSVTWNKPPLFGLTTVMSKLLMLGMPLDQLLACVTSTPARLISGSGGPSTLAPGSAADIAVLRLEDKAIGLIDAEGQTRTGSRFFRTMATLLDGAIVYRSQEIDC